MSQRDLLLQGFKRISTVRVFFTHAGQPRGKLTLLVVCTVLAVGWPLAAYAEMWFFQRGTWITIAASLYYGMVSVLSIYVQARTWKELHNCRQELEALLATEENKNTFSELLKRSYSSRGRPVFVVLCVAIILVSLFALDHTHHDTLQRLFGMEFGVVTYLQIAVIAAIAAIAVYWLLKTPRIVLRLMKLDELHLNTLEPIEHPAIRELSTLFSKSSLRAAVGILINGMPIILLMSVLHVEWFTWVIAIGISAGVFITVGVFVLPQLGMHELALKTRLRMMVRIASRIDRGDALATIAELYRYQVVAGARTWAVDVTVLARYGLALLSPIVPLLFQLYIRSHEPLPL